MRNIYSRLHSQSFPDIGKPIEITATKFETRQERIFWPQKKSSQQITSYVKRIRRPIDFRMEGSSICKLLDLKQILLLYATVLQERRVVVISSSLRYYSTKCGLK